MPSHTAAEKLKKASRILSDPSKLLGLQAAAKSAASSVEKEIKRILGFITGGKKKK